MQTTLFDGSVVPEPVADTATTETDETLPTVSVETLETIEEPALDEVPTISVDGEPAATETETVPNGEEPLPEPSTRRGRAVPRVPAEAPPPGAPAERARPDTRLGETWRGRNDDREAARRREDRRREADRPIPD